MQHPWYLMKCVDDISLSICSLQIMLQYNVPDYRNSMEFFTCLAKKRGYLQKGAQPNTEQAAVSFLSDWTGYVITDLVKN